MKACRDCATEKPLDAFPPAVKRSDGRGSYCKDCMRVRSRISYRKRQAARGLSVRDRPIGGPGERRCPDCEQVKPLEGFPRNRSKALGRERYCLPCHTARGRANRIRQHGSTRDYHLKKRYGLTSAEVDAMVAAQGGVCAICQERPPQHVDHDHLTGAVRGVLCSCCNQALGNLRDRADVARACATYLERTTWQRVREAPGVYRLVSPTPAPPASSTSSLSPRQISSLRAAACRTA